jgi:hypothetical protein
VFCPSRVVSGMGNEPRHTDEKRTLNKEELRRRDSSPPREGVRCTHTTYLISISPRRKLICLGGEVRPGEGPRLVQAVPDRQQAEAQEVPLEEGVPTDKDWCQKLIMNKCRRSHNVLIHMDAEDERDLRTSRPTKLAKSPDRVP